MTFSCYCLCLTPKLIEAERHSTCEGLDNVVVKRIFGQKLSNGLSIYDVIKRVVDNTCGELVDDDPYALYKEDPSVPCESVGKEFCQFQKTCGKAPLNNHKLRKSVSPYIAFGQDAKPGEWPSFATLSAQPGSVVSCSGVLISDRHVLTAAHCIHDSDTNLLVDISAINVTLGDLRIGVNDDEEKEFKVTKVCGSKPLDYDRDWAVLTLNKKVIFNDYIQPACLPFEPIERIADSSRCFSVGVGLVAGTNVERIFPKTLQMMRVKRVSCKSEHWIDSNTCIECYSSSNYSNATVCQGDSGGPVMCLDADNRWTVVALTHALSDFCGSSKNKVAMWVKLRKILTKMKDKCGFV